MLNVVISYDYELFLGDNYEGPDKILFEPTDMLIDLMEKHNVTSTFFVDVCSVFAHIKYGQEEYVNKFSSQIRKMILNGHDVQLHIHPNWYLSEYIDGKWVFNTSHYMIHKFGFDIDDKKNVYAIVDECIEYLESLIKPIFPDYNCIAFRAGGYSVQPHSLLFEYLRKKGVLIDSSVCRNLFCLSETLNYDFRNMPEQTNWWITPGKPFNYCGGKNDGGLFEVPLLSEKNNLIKKLLKSEYSQEFSTEPIRGAYIKLCDVCPQRQNIISKTIKYMRSYSLVSFDSMSSYRMIGYLTDYEKKHRTENPVVSIICHPKLVDRGILDNMEKVLLQLNTSNRFCFTNMSRIKKDIL